uniref:Uncharacterized protein n=1 Tax=Anguilla anguilla TaxID=7936 RepID=A0A0E9T8K5_ANGAN
MFYEQRYFDTVNNNFLFKFMLSKCLKSF